MFSGRVQQGRKASFLSQTPSMFRDAHTCCVQEMEQAHVVMSRTLRETSQTEPANLKDPEKKA